MAAELSLGPSSYPPKRETDWFAEEVIAEIGFSFWLKPFMIYIARNEAENRSARQRVSGRVPTA
jgi:hypothetical protein